MMQLQQTQLPSTCLTEVCLVTNYNYCLSISKLFLYHYYLSLGDELDTSTQAVPKGNREIDFKEYKLPTNFGHVIDEKLKNGKGLTFNETGEICRHLKNSVCLQTFKPSSDSCRKVVRMLLSKYPGSLVGDHQDEFATEVV